MNEKITAALKSNNSLVRRQAIMALSRTTSEDAIRLLASVYRNDPESDLREMAKDAAKQIRERLNEKELKAQQKDPSLPQRPPPARKLEGAEKRRVEKAEEERSANFNLLIFGAIVLILGGVVVAILLGGNIARISDQNQALAQVENALPFVEGRTPFGSSLEGKIYRYASSGANFILLEPKGAPPQQGWTLLAGVYDGKPENVIGGLARRASTENVMLLVPIYSTNDFGTMANELAFALDVVKRNYPVYRNTQTLYGFGVGAEFASQFVVWYPTEFAVASVGNGTSYTPPDLQTGARYIVFAGQNDEVSARATSEFIARLTSLGKRPAQAGVLQGRGIEEIPEQLEATFALINQINAPAQ